MATVNDLYRDELFRRATRVESFENSLVEKLILILNRTEGDLADKITNELRRLGDGPVSSARLQRLDAMLARLRTLRTEAWREVNQELRADLGALAQAESDFAVNAFQRSTGLENVGLAAPAAATLRSAVFSRPFQLSNNAKTISEWMASLRLIDADRILETVRLGFIQSSKIEDIVRSVRGTRKLKYRDGVTQVTRRNLEAVVRTAVNHFSNQARSYTWEQNSDIIIGLVWTSVLDGRTTPVCMSRDGRATPLGDNKLPPDLPALVPADARPPAHAACRSIMVAIVSPEGLIGDRPFVVDVRTGKQRTVDFRRMARQQGRSVEEVRRRWAQTRIGRLPAETTYEEFFRAQSREFQTEVLGKTRAKLFRDGGLSLQDFVSRSGRKLTIVDLRRLDAGAFKKAGLKT